MSTESHDRAAARPRAGTWAVWLVVAVGLLVVLLTFEDFGPTWDEAIQARYGELALAYFASGGADTRCNEYLDLRFYGPLVEMAPALLDEGSGAAAYETRHLLLGLLALTLIPAAWIYARLFRIAPLALFALPAVALQPRLFGHWFNNSKDLPFAVLVLWFMVSVALMVVARRVSWRLVTLSGALLGLTLCVRPGGLPLLLAYLAGGLGLRALVSDRTAGAATAPLAVAGSWIAKLFVLVAIAWALMVLPWPWAHQAPFGNPVAAMRLAADFPTTMPVLFAGQSLSSDSLPRSYPLRYLAIATPPTLLLLALAAPVLVWLSRRRHSRSYLGLVALTALWPLFPLALFAALRPNVYGGMRHFLFVLPAIGILAAVGASEMWDRLRRTPIRRWAGSLLLVAMVYPVIPMVRLHPYQASYYNTLVGGVEGASGRYWTDYSLSSYAEAIRWINQRPRLPGETTRIVLAAGPPVLLWARDYAASDVEVVLMRRFEGRRRSLPPSHYYVGSTRLDADRAFPDDPVVHTVGRAGAVFTVIKSGPAPGSLPRKPPEDSGRPRPR